MKSDHPQQDQQTRSWVIAIHVFFISISLLMVEVLSTRLAKIVFSQKAHTQFIILSLAMLGIGVGGMIVYRFFNDLKNNYIDQINHFTIIYCVVTFLPYLTFHLSSIVNVAYTELLFLSMLLFFLAALFLVYVIAGILIALAFRYYQNNVAILYCANLLGSALGCFAAIIALDLIGNERSALLSIAFAVLAMVLLIWSHRNSRRSWMPFFYLIFIVVLFFRWPQVVQVQCNENFNPRLKHLTIQPEFRGSNSLAYIESHRISKAHRFIIDCYGYTHSTDASKLRGRKAQAKHMHYFPFLLDQYDSVLVIGAGAGNDVSRALIGGSQRVTAVEINPMIKEGMDQLIRFDDNIYEHENVDLKIQEGRNFVANTQQTFDLINISSAKSYGGIGIKDSIFLPNFIYTDEAFRVYFERLNDQGVLYLVHREGDVRRIFETLIYSLQMKELDPTQTMLLIQQGDRAGILVKKNGLTASERLLAGQQAEKNNYTIRFVDENDILAAQHRAILTDDQPFFRKVRKKNLFQDNADEEKLAPLERLTFPLLFSLLVYLAFLFWPSNQHRDRALRWKTTAYFTCLGIGFMLTEIVLVHLFTLYLSNPSYAISVVLTGLLLFGGLGSLWTTRFLNRQLPSIVRRSCLLFGVAVMAMLILLPLLFSATDHWPVSGKIGMALVVLVIPGLCLGVPFPAGLRLISAQNSQLIPYMWGINGIAAVLGSIVVMMMMVLWGFKCTLLGAVIPYGIVAMLANTGK